MPAFQTTAASYTLIPSPSFVVHAVSSSEAASLKGKPAKTPLLAGSIIGSIMGAAYVVGFTIYFVRRSRRKKRNALIRAGLAEYNEPKPKERVISPPDPAIVLGFRHPGERAFQQDTPADVNPSTTTEPHTATNPAASVPVTSNNDPRAV